MPVCSFDFFANFKMRFLLSIRYGFRVGIKIQLYCNIPCAKNQYFLLLWRFFSVIHKHTDSVIENVQKSEVNLMPVYLFA